MARLAGWWKIRGEQVARAHRRDAQCVSFMVIWSVARCSPGQRAGFDFGFLAAAHVHRHRSRSGFTFFVFVERLTPTCGAYIVHGALAARITGEAFDEYFLGPCTQVQGRGPPS